MVFSANFKGLNVIYFFQNNQITSYQDLYDKLVSYINLNMSIYIKLNYPNNSFLEKIFISYDIISFLLIKMNSYENKQDSLKDFLTKKKGCVDENDWRILDSITQMKEYILNLVPKFLEENKVSKITFLDEFILEMREKNHQIKYKIFAHNLEEYAINLSILKFLELDSSFNIEYYQNIIQSSKHNSNECIFFSDDLINDLKPAALIGSWTALMTTFFYTKLENKLTKSCNIISLIMSNIKPDFYFDLINQFSFFLPILKKLGLGYSSKNEVGLEQFLSSKLKIAYFLDKGLKMGQFKKYKFFLSNEKIYYFPIILISKDDLNIDTKRRLFYCKFDIFFQGSNDTKVFNDNKDILEDYHKMSCTSSYLYLDDHKNFHMYFYRDLMINFIQSFVKSDKILKLQSEYKVNFQFPKSQVLPIKMLLDTYTFSNFLMKKKQTYPILIKFAGYQPLFEHKMTIIINDEGFINFSQYLRTLNIKEEKKLILQEYSNHGGYLLKIYRINKKNYCYFRPSTPDINKDNLSIKEFSKGYFDFETSFLSTNEFANFWAKFDNNSKVKNKFNFEFLDKISEQFEIDSKNTLFGLDMIYDYKNDINYFIDCNYFPGYTELGKDVESVLTDHILNIWSKYKSE